MNVEKNSENSEGMYSYKSGNNNNNINKNESNSNDTNENNNKVPIYESDAIRRSYPNNIDNKEININNQYSNKFQSNMLKNNNINNYNSGSFVGRSSQISIELPQDSILHWSFILIYIILEVILIIVIATLFDWDKRNHPNYSCIEYKENDADISILNSIYKETEKELSTYYGLFRDINIMAFVGFGMLHTLTQGNTWTSIAFDILSIVLSFQISLFFNLIFENAFKESWNNGVLNFDTFIKAIFNSCAILVSLGAVHGKISHIQYLVLIISETILSSLNLKLCDVKLKIIDTGGGLYIHTFGALFGIAIYIVLFRSKKKRARLSAYNRANITNYLSNITCFVGVLFILNYLPSFNSGLALSDDGRYRAAINTYFSIIGSIVMSFIITGFIYNGKFIYEYILFGSFSGGIIISTCCSVCLDHWAALLIGMLCGVICIILFKYLNELFLELGYYDIYNIIIVHGIPGILGAFISSMFISDLDHRVDNYYNILLKDMERTNRAQAGIQIAAIFITCAISFVGGITVGFLIKVSRCGKIKEYFDDNEFFYGKLDGEFNNNNFNDNMTDIEDNNQPSFMNDA